MQISMCSPKHNLCYIQADEERVEEATMSEVEIWNGKNRLQTQVGHHSETVPRIINVLFALLSSTI